MRYARLKPVGINTFMHVYNRTVGSAGEFLFRNTEKEEFVRRLMKLSQFYVIDVISYQCMGNHFHALLHIPADPPSNKEAARRYKQHYGGKRTIDPNSAACGELAAKLRDVSEYMKDLQQPFTRWFNRTRPVRRRGHLWADRFKNTILENGLAVWDCWKYIEMNPARARMVANPADYRFCSFGRWCATGTHPFQEAVTKLLLPVFRGLLHVESMEEIRTELKKEFARIIAVESRESPEKIDTAIAVAAEREAFSTRIDRRVRYWVDGLVIGSESFVRDTIATARIGFKVRKRRLVRAVSHTEAQSKDSRPVLYCFKQLRLLLE
ncbi:MAG: hypothetical protein HQ559_08375 [Lentisphaerae bacterium]|nr:hypothetical protein [Lentisphaerota bacterium]